MFKGHQFQNLKNSVKTKESMSQRLGIKRDWERYHVQSFCLMYGETEAGRVRSPGGQRGIGKLFPPHSSQEVGAGL